MRKRKARKIGIILACVWCFVLAGIVVTELLSQQPSKRPAAAEHPGNASVSVSKETKQAPTEPESTGNTVFETGETEEIRTEETTIEPETEPETTKEPETEPPRPSETVPLPTQPVVVPTAPAVTPVAGDGIIICLDAGHKPGGGISEKEPNGPGSDVMKAKLTTGTKGAVGGVVYYEYNVNQQVT
ncbi:MAG: hypothetical protein IK088_04035, partial [Lachnospiraceae bacterium]|nr:hypothetical protein [Lachnospiraceae bacterium]